MSGTPVGTPLVPDATRVATRGTRAWWPALRTDRVLQVAVALVVLQLAFRAWATYGSWFAYDDFTFMSRMRNEGLSPTVAGRPYAGHLMPAGMYLTWLTDAVAPFDFRLPATLLLGMQLLADVGLLVLLLRMFGSRPGILPPLALYLFWAISVPVAVWWAAGINQLPMQVAMFWSLACHVTYLRTGRLRHAVAACAWVLAGLAFYEKVLLVLGALGLVTLCYFVTGTVRERLRSLWSRYRAGTVLYAVVGAAYLTLYVFVGLNFNPTRADNEAVSEVASNMVARAWAPAVVGGPLRWRHIDQFALPEPGMLGMLAGLAGVVLVAREIRRCRTNSLRAWLLPGYFLGCDILLVAAGRASFVGAQISLDYRYQGELAGVTAIALACAVLPIRGALETATLRAPSELLDHPRRVAVAVACVCALATASSTQYVLHWNGSGPGKAYFENLTGHLEARRTPVTLVDQPVPDAIMWPVAYPLNLQSYLLGAYADRTRFVTAATDDLRIVTDEGDIQRVVVPPTREGRPGPAPHCGYRVRAGHAATVRLDGPVVFGGWWVRIGYIATDASPVHVTAGDASYDTTVRPGLHALYVRGGAAQFDEVRISGLVDDVSLCTDEVTVGHPVPRSEYTP